MLKRIALFNYALVDSVELELGEGLNIFTGETGAGKSILIGAMAALLGEKAAHNAARDPEGKAVIEGLFVNCLHPNVVDLLARNEIELSDDRSLLIRREFHPSGRSRAFVNDTPVNTGTLEELSDLLADLHGQHEHQSLLRPRTHLAFLDAFGGLDSVRAEVSLGFEKVREIRSRYSNLLNRQSELRSRRDLEIFQLQEIKQVDPQPGEEETLAREIRLLGNAERRAELASQAYLLLYDSESAIQVQLSTVLTSLQELAEIDPALKGMLEDCRTAGLTLSEAAKEIQSYQDKIEFDASRLEQARQRTVELQKLKRKYGGTMVAVFQRLAELQQNLSTYENFETELSNLERELKEAQELYSRLAQELSDRRKAAAEKLEQEVPKVLAELGLPVAKFVVQFACEPQTDGFVTINGAGVKANRDGIDQVAFYLSTNPGHSVAPLDQIASGGEISRIMLALKSIIAEKDEIPILIFDEIDSGVSGRVAQAVGKRMQKLAASHQIICITHLPQIASAGQHHFLVEKKTKSGRSQTAVRRLSAAERPKAIATLLGGEKITESHLKSAQELLAEAGNRV